MDERYEAFQDRVVEVCGGRKWKSTDQTSAHSEEGDLGSGWNTEWVRAHVVKDKVKMLKWADGGDGARRDQGERTACHDEGR